MIVLERNHRTPLKAQMDLPKLLCIRWAVKISNSCLGICSEPLQCWGSTAKVLSTAGVTVAQVWPHVPISGEQKIAAGQSGSKMGTGLVFPEGWAAALSQRQWHASVSSMKEMDNASILTYAWSMSRWKCFQSCLWCTLQVCIFWVLRPQPVGTFQAKDISFIFLAHC